MIKFLKESTFDILDVFSDSFKILARKYIPIATLCFILFIITTLSGVFSQYHSIYLWVNILYKILGLVIFVFLYFIFQLFLLKYILGIVDGHPHPVFDKFNFPNFYQIYTAIIAAIYLILAIFITFIVVAILFFPLIYMHISVEDTLLIFKIGTVLALVFLWVRISFFPFFIVDKQTAAFESLRLSFAITRGNILKIFSLFLCIFMVYGVSFYLSTHHQLVVALIVNLVVSFVIVPLSSIVITVAYRKTTLTYLANLSH